MKFERWWPKLRHARVGTLISTMRHERNFEYWSKKVGTYTPLEVRGRRIGTAKIDSVQRKVFNTIPLMTLKLDTEPVWSFDDIVRYFKGHYPEFVPTDNITFIWLEVTSLVYPKGGIRGKDVLRQDHIS